MERESQVGCKMQSARIRLADDALGLSPHSLLRGKAGLIHPLQRTFTGIQVMPESDHEKLARATASGIHVANYDRAIGALVLLGLIFFPLVPQTTFVGIPLLLLFIWARSSELKG